MPTKPLVYIAGPLYTPAERSYLEEIESICATAGFETYLPHRDGGLAPANGSSTTPFFKKDIAALNDCTVVVAILNGTDVDSGTAWEVGYAYARQRALLGIFEDTRIDSPLASLNLMITSSITIFQSRDSLAEELKKIARQYDRRDTSRPVEIQEADVNVVLAHVTKLPLDLGITSPETFGHETPSLCCVDAVLSINRPYRSFVVPRLNRFRQLLPQVRRLGELSNTLRDQGKEHFANAILNYKDYHRVDLLQNLVTRLLEIVGDCGSLDEEMAALRGWAQKADITGQGEFMVKGIGLATYQYLRMLFGADTVKPDIHITAVVSEALGKKSPERKTILLLEAVAKKLGVSALALDHAIWSLNAKDK